MNPVMPVQHCWNCGCEVVTNRRFCDCVLAATNLPTPLNIGRYQVKAFLGAGRFSHVYLAADPNLSRLVAIKRLTLESTKARDIITELHAHASLSHAHIALLFDADPNDGYIVMEYLPFHSLAYHLSNDITFLRHQFDNIAVSLAEALSFAHRNRVIHRDITPNNIVFKDAATPKLIDFGLAKLLTSHDHAQSQVGTPHFTAPEIWDSPEYDATVDIYSLGVVFYLIWTGMLPFDAPTPIGLQIKVLSGQYAPPLSINPDMPPAYDALIRRMLAIRGERIGSMEAVLSELRRPSFQRVKTVTIDDFQREFSAIYGFRNNRRSPLVLAAHLLAVVNGLVDALTHLEIDGSTRRAESYFVKVFAWLCALLTALDWPASKLIWFKYPNHCPYCGTSPCNCRRGALMTKAEYNSIALQNAPPLALDDSVPPMHVDEYATMFDRIYGDANRSSGITYVCLKLYSAVADTIDALLRVRSLEDLRQVSVLHLELADIVAWFFGALVMYGRGFKLGDATHSMIPGRCYVCGQERCRCPEIEHEIRLASWTSFR